MSEDKVASAGDTTGEAARNQLQQFCQLAKTAQGAAILDVIKQILDAPGVYVFAELLELPNVKELSTTNPTYYNTLNLFAYGTSKQYRQEREKFLELTPAMQKKLQHLTIISLATRSKCIPYQVLLEELEIDNVRNLEDIIIEAIYADIIHGKLFQNKRILEIDYAQGRDVPPGHISKIISTLDEWVKSCDAVSACIAEQINHANNEKAKRLRNKENIEQEVTNLKKMIKTQISDNIESMPIDSRDAAGTSQELRKKIIKSKSRAMGKLSASIGDGSGGGIGGGGLGSLGGLGGGGGGSGASGAAGGLSMGGSWFRK